MRKREWETLGETYHVLAGRRGRPWEVERRRTSSEKRWQKGRERSKQGGKSKRWFYWRNKFPGFRLAKKGTVPEEQNRVPDGKGLGSDVAKICPK